MSDLPEQEKITTPDDAKVKAAITPKKEIVASPAPSNDDNSNDEAGDPANKDYEERRSLRAENKARRLEITELKALVKDAVSQSQLASTEIQNLKQTYEQRLIDAELKIAANEHGLQDFDAFKMIDLSTLKIGQKGEVTGISEIMESLKTSKPYLFKAPITTSSKVRIPNNHTEPDAIKSLKDVASKEVDKSFNDYLKSIK